MTFDEHARAQAQTLLDALSAEIANTARAELDALRTEVDVRTVALEKALARGDHSALLAPHVETLAAAAREAAEAQGSQARAEAEKRAEEKLSASLAEASRRAEEKLATALADASAGADETLARALADQSARAEAARVKAQQHAEDERRQAAQRAEEQLRAVDDERAELLLALEEARSENRTLVDSFLGLLAGVETAIQAINRATMPDAILDALLDHIGDHFEQTAVLYVGRSIRGWRARRQGATTDLSGVHIPDTVTSFVTRVVADREALTVAASADGPLVGMNDNPIANAIALPLCANGRVLAVVYAENLKESGASSRGVGFKVANILVEQATRRLTKRSAAAKAAPEEYSSPRQARRVKLQASVNITLDGSASFLVDLSSLGAQVLSPLALRPNRVVELELVGGAQTVQCKGRVVWAFFEQSKGAALYRAGVQFTEVDSNAVDAFLAMQGVPQEFPQSTAASAAFS